MVFVYELNASISWSFDPQDDNEGKLKAGTKGQGRKANNEIQGGERAADDDDTNDILTLDFMTAHRGFGNRCGRCMGSCHIRLCIHILRACVYVCANVSVCVCISVSFFL